MTERRDEEFWIVKTVDAIKANINAKIDAINSAATDSIVLKNIDPDAFYYLTFGNTFPNYDPVFIFAAEVVPEDTAGGLSSYRVSIMTQITVSALIAGSGMEMVCILSRYRQAIKEVIESTCERYHALKIVPLTGTAFVVKSGGLYYTTGVGIEFSYA